MQEIAGNLPDANVLTKAIIGTAKSELPDEKKWPRRWRLLFILGASIALWTLIIIAIRLL